MLSLWNVPFGSSGSVGRVENLRVTLQKHGSDYLKNKGHARNNISVIIFPDNPAGVEKDSVTSKMEGMQRQ